MDEILAAIKEQTRLLGLLASKPAEPSMSTIVASYQTKTTFFTTVVGSWFELLKPDTRRWYVRFSTDSVTPVGVTVVPDPTDQSQAVGTAVNLPLEFHFRDCPAITTGRFWYRASSAIVIRIFEDIYLRG